MDQLPQIDSLSTFIYQKKPHKFSFVGLKCQKCRDLLAFLGVKSGLFILVRVKLKDLTFSNSGPSPKISLRKTTGWVIYFLGGGILVVDIFLGGWVIYRQPLLLLWKNEINPAS